VCISATVVQRRWVVVGRNECEGKEEERGEVGKEANSVGGSGGKRKEQTLLRRRNSEAER
jgi:hypothetical protein